MLRLCFYKNLPNKTLTLATIANFTMVWLCVTSFSLAWADQVQITSAEDAESLFWVQVYPSSGWTLYCGDPFNSSSRDASNTSVERIYSMSWVAEYLGCGNEEDCRDENDRFNRIEADLHNLYPALQMIIRSRNDFHYSTIPGEFREFYECNFEYDTRDKVVEPRSLARGNISRAMLYMNQEYGLPISENSLRLMKNWNLEDPPSKDELRRNDIIEKLQATRNRFIDNPELANTIFFSPDQSVSEQTPDPNSANASPNVVETNIVETKATQNSTTEGTAAKIKPPPNTAPNP